MDYKKKTLIFVVQSCGRFVSSNILPEVNMISEQTWAVGEKKKKPLRDLIQRQREVKY